jgi:hypothetical protein
MSFHRRIISYRALYMPLLLLLLLRVHVVRLRLWLRLRLLQQLLLLLLLLLRVARLLLMWANIPTAAASVHRMMIDLEEYAQQRFFLPRNTPHAGRRWPSKIDISYMHQSQAVGPQI